MSKPSDDGKAIASAAATSAKSDDHIGNLTRYYNEKRLSLDLKVPTPTLTVCGDCFKIDCDIASDNWTNPEVIISHTGKNSILVTGNERWTPFKVKLFKSPGTTSVTIRVSDKNGRIGQSMAILSL